MLLLLRLLFFYDFLLLCFCQLAFFFGFAEPLQLGNQHQADQRCGKAAVVQQEAAVQGRYSRNQQIMQTASQHAAAPAVLAGNGAQAVGVAQTDHNGLVADGQSKISLTTVIANQ